MRVPHRLFIIEIIKHFSISMVVESLGLWKEELVGEERMKTFHSGLILLFQRRNFTSGEVCLGFVRRVRGVFVEVA